jgi:formate--tetrahydrofolate ligase
MKRVEALAEELGLPEEAWQPYGRWIGKVDPSLVGMRRAKPGKIVLVTAITPTAFGVGKTVTTIGLGSALNRIGVRSIACLRQPSLGPVFGIKGGGAGGGRATVEPFVDINLGLTGDLDAVSNAHNLLAALVDNVLHHGNSLSIDPGQIFWPRTLDMEDRALRDIEIGLGDANGPPRRGSFIITPASEVTAILGLARGYKDLHERLGRILVARDRSGRMVSASAIGAAGPMTALLRRAIYPNLMQSSDGAPVLVHGGPFGNLSYGTTTVSSTRLAQSLVDVAVVEAGFATDLGAEKFVNLVSPIGGFSPSAAVLVASIPVLKSHRSAAGEVGLAGGLENLERHVQNLRVLGLGACVALNRFPTDEEKEVAAVKEFCGTLGVPVADSFAFARGGEGCEDLARNIQDVLSKNTVAHPTYSANMPVLEKMDRIVREIYGGDGIDLSPEAEAQLKDPSWREFGNLPVCMAKTALSISDNPKLTGRPRGFRITTRRFIPAAGAGYLVALLGNIQTMPGLPSAPRSGQMELAPDGTVQGLK